jgi:hypothetical protein
VIARVSGAAAGREWLDAGKAIIPSPLKDTLELPGSKALAPSNLVSDAPVIALTELCAVTEAASRKAAANSGWHRERGVLVPAMKDAFIFAVRVTVKNLCTTVF